MSDVKSLRFDAATGRGFLVAVALATSCATDDSPPPELASRTSGDEGPAPPSEGPVGETTFDAALEAAVPLPTSTRPAPASVTVAGGCAIPCGTSHPHRGVVMSVVSDDPTYGTTRENPIPVGHLDGYAEEVFLLGLFGPNGEEVRFERIGSCCQGYSAGLMLDMIAVSYEGLDAPVVLYLDPYADAGIDRPMLVPMGFRGVATGTTLLTPR